MPEAGKAVTRPDEPRAAGAAAGAPTERARVADAEAPGSREVDAGGLGGRHQRARWGATGLRWRRVLLAFVAYLAGAFVLTVATWASPTTGWAGGCCDPEQSIWFLGWTPHALANGLDPFFTTAIGAPAGVNLMWNAGTPILGLAAWLPSLLGGPIFGYNVVLVLSVALSGWTAFLAVRRHAGSDLAAFVGGGVYGFSPYVASHAALHLNLASAWVPPLFLLVLDELLVRRVRPAWLLGVVLGLLSVVQLLIAEEVLATSVIAAGVLVAVMAIGHRDVVAAGVRRLVPALLAATATFLAVGALPLAAQFLGPQRISARVQDPNSFSTDLLNLVLPTPYQLIAPSAATDISRHFSTLFHEATGYLGLPLLVLIAIVAVRRRHDSRIRVAALTGAILLVLALGPHLHVGGHDTGLPMPWLPLASLPLVEHVLPGRLTLYVWLAAAVVVAVVLGELLGEARTAGLRPPAARLLGVALAVVVILPAPLRASTVEIPAFFRDWRAQGIGPGETVLVAPFFRNGAQAAPMVWAAVTDYGLRMPEAYAYMPQPGGGTSSGPPATTLSDLMSAIQRSGHVIVARGGARTQIAADLRAAQVRHVIVGPMATRAAMLAFFTDLFGRPPESSGGIAIWRDVDVAGVVPATSDP